MGPAATGTLTSHQQDTNWKHGYSQFYRQSPADGEFTVKIDEVELDDYWVVPYNPVLSQPF